VRPRRGGPHDEDDRDEQGTRREHDKREHPRSPWLSRRRGPASGLVGERRRDLSEMSGARPASGPNEVAVERKRGGTQLISRWQSIRDCSISAAGRPLKPLVNVALLLRLVVIDRPVLPGRNAAVSGRFGILDVGDERVEERIRGHVERGRICE
jgi:hypothetical protein